MSLDPRHEHPLATPPDTPLWSENFALVFNDAENRISSLYSIGTWYLDTSIWRENLAVALPDGDILVARNFGRNTQGTALSAALSRYKVVEPERRAVLSFSGPAWRHSFRDLLQPGAYGGKTSRLELRLEFEAGQPMWDMHGGHGEDRTGLAGAMHIEQLGRCTGMLRLDGRETAIADAASCRDHSRGSRDIANYRNHCWINGSFPGGRAFQLYIFKMHHIEGNALSLATVIQDGVHHPATIEHIEFVDSAADHGKPQHVVLKSALGEMRIDIREVLATIPVTMTAPFNPAMGVVAVPHGLIFDEPIRIEWEGQAGLGWSERGFSKQRL